MISYIIGIAVKLTKIILKGDYRYKPPFFYYLFLTFKLKSVLKVSIISI